MGEHLPTSIWWTPDFWTMNSIFGGCLQGSFGNLRCNSEGFFRVFGGHSICLKNICECQSVSLFYFGMLPPKNPGVAIVKKRIMTLFRIGGISILHLCFPLLLGRGTSQVIYPTDLECYRGLDPRFGNVWNGLRLHILQLSTPKNPDPSRFLLGLIDPNPIAIRLVLVNSFLTLDIHCHLLRFGIWTPQTYPKHFLRRYDWMYRAIGHTDQIRRVRHCGWILWSTNPAFLVQHQLIQHMIDIRPVSSSYRQEQLCFHQYIYRAVENGKLWGRFIILLNKSRISGYPPQCSTFSKEGLIELIEGLLGDNDG